MDRSIRGGNQGVDNEISVVVGRIKVCLRQIQSAGDPAVLWRGNMSDFWWTGFGAVGVWVTGAAVFYAARVALHLSKPRLKIMCKQEKASPIPVPVLKVTVLNTGSFPVDIGGADVSTPFRWEEVKDRWHDWKELFPRLVKRERFVPLWITWKMAFEEMAQKHRDRKTIGVTPQEGYQTRIEPGQTTELTFNLHNLSQELSQRGFEGMATIMVRVRDQQNRRHKGTFTYSIDQVTQSFQM